MIDKYRQLALKRWRWFRYGGEMARLQSVEQFRQLIGSTGESAFHGYEQWDPISRRDIAAVLDTLSVELRGKTFLDIGPGYGSAMDIARERGADRVEFVDYDPFVCAFNRLKGHAGRRLDVRRQLGRLCPQTYDFIWLKATFSADRFLALDKQGLLRRFKLYPPLADILRDVDQLLAPGGTVAFCPHWDCASGRRRIENVRTTTVAATLAEHGYRTLPWIDGHNMEPFYPLSFAKTRR